MADEVLEPGQVSREKLQSLYSRAYVQYKLDQDGDIVVDEVYKFFVMPSAEQETLTFICHFRAAPGKSLAERYEYVNSVNDNLIAIRAFVRENGGLGFDHTILTGGGVTDRQIVMATKEFGRLLQAALRRDTGNVIS